MTHPTRVAIIMAGGSGERFWPLSRPSRPKQLLPLTPSGRSLLEEAVLRVQPLIPSERIFIATSPLLRDPIERCGLGIPPGNILAEPCKRNTAGCLAFATACILARLQSDGSDVSVAVLTGDHLIPDNEAFAETMERVLSAAERNNALGVIGVPPTRPDTGLGYIEIAKGARPAPGSDARRPVYPVLRFREKPNLETAEEFIATGRFYWNSGMFFWPVSAFLGELEQASPAHARAVRSMVEALGRGDADGAEATFRSLGDISIDYALMERARRVIMAPASFRWDDIGALDAIERIRPRDSRGNVTVGDTALVDASNSILYNECAPGQMTLAAVGIEGLVVIATADAVLVMPKSRAQDVRKVVAQLKDRAAGR